MNNLIELASIISLLLLFRHSSTALLCQCFIQQRIRRQRLCLHFINAIAHSIYYLTAQQNNCACAHAPKSVWVFPRPQMWFQQLVNGHALHHLWKENFRVTRATFEYICQLVGQALHEQDTQMGDAIPVEKRVGAYLWRLVARWMLPLIWIDDCTFQISHDFKKDHVSAAFNMQSWPPGNLNLAPSYLTLNSSVYFFAYLWGLPRDWSFYLGVLEKPTYLPR